MRDIRLFRAKMHEPRFPCADTHECLFRAEMHERTAADRLDARPAGEARILAGEQEDVAVGLHLVPEEPGAEVSHPAIAGGFSGAISDGVAHACRLHGSFRGKTC